MTQLIASLQSGGSPLANIPGIQDILKQYQQNRTSTSGGNFFGGGGGTPAQPGAMTGASPNPYAPPTDTQPTRPY